MRDSLPRRDAFITAKRLLPSHSLIHQLYCTYCTLVYYYYARFRIIGSIIDIDFI